MTGLGPTFRVYLLRGTGVGCVTSSYEEKKGRAVNYEHLMCTHLHTDTCTEMWNRNSFMRTVCQVRICMYA